MRTDVRPVRVLDRGALAGGGRLRDDAGRPARAPRPPAADSRERDRGVRRDAGPGRLLDGVDLRDQQGRASRSRRRSAAAWPQALSTTASDLERPGVAGELDGAPADLEAAVVVPEEVRRPRRQPAPAEHLLAETSALGERGDRAPQHAAWPRGGPSVNMSARPSSSRSRRQRGTGRTGRRSRRRARRRAGCRRVRQPPGEQRRGPRVEIRVARQAHVERLELPRGLGAASSGASPPRFWANASSAWSRSTRARPSSSSAPASAVASSPMRHIERPRAQAGLGGGERPIGPPRADRRSARPRAAGTPRRRPGPRAPAPGRPSARAPRATSSSGPAAAAARCHARRSGSTLAIRGLSQRQVGRPALLDRRRSGTRPSAPADDGTSPARRSSSSPSAPSPRPPDRDPEPLAGAPQEQRIADRLRRRHQQQTPRVVGQRLESPDEALLDPPGRACAAPPAGRSRPPAASPSNPAAARATPAGCPASRR